MWSAYKGVTWDADQSNLAARTSCGRESRFDSEPAAVCVLAKALKKKHQYGIRKLQMLIVVHLRIGSEFKGVLHSRFCTFCHRGVFGYCLFADTALRDEA